MRRSTLTACILALGTSGCPDDAPPADDVPMASGFAEEDTDPGDQGTQTNPGTGEGPSDSGEPSTFS